MLKGSAVKHVQCKCYLPTNTRYLSLKALHTAKRCFRWVRVLVCLWMNPPPEKLFKFCLVPDANPRVPHLRQPLPCRFVLEGLLSRDILDRPRCRLRPCGHPSGHPGGSIRFPKSPSAPTASRPQLVCEPVRREPPLSSINVWGIGGIWVTKEKWHRFWKKTLQKQ